MVAADGRFDLIISPVLLEEFGDVVARQHLCARVDRPYFAAPIANNRREAILIDDRRRERHVPSAPDGDSLISLALAARAHVIVTGDRPALNLRLETAGPASSCQATLSLRSSGLGRAGLEGDSEEPTEQQKPSEAFDQLVAVTA